MTAFLMLPYFPFLSCMVLCMEREGGEVKFPDRPILLLSVMCGSTSSSDPALVTLIHLISVVALTDTSGIDAIESIVQW